MFGPVFRSVFYYHHYLEVSRLWTLLNMSEATSRSLALQTV